MSKSEIDKICNEHNIHNYTINEDGSIDVNGFVDLNWYDFKEFPIKFNIIRGSFKCNNNELTSLKNGPVEVYGNFECDNNELTSLEGGPKLVTGSFHCNDNGLTSLKGSPKEVGGYFNCNNNKLTSLKYGPQKVGDSYWCGYNNLTSLEFNPKSISGTFFCVGNKLKTLVGSELEFVTIFNCSGNNLTDLKGAPKKVNEIGVGSNYIMNFNGFESEFLTINIKNNPIEKLIGSDLLPYDFVKAFKTFKIIDENKVNLKRFKYVMSLFNLDTKYLNIPRFYKTT